MAEKDSSKILMGKIVNAVGLKGEVKVYNYSDSIDLYLNTDAVWVDRELRKIKNVRLQKNMVVLKLEGIDDRDAAERLRNAEIFVTEEDLPELPEGEYYVRDIIGMDVVTDDGGNLGIIKDVLQNSAQDIFEIEDDTGKTFLIPKVPDFVLSIDLGCNKVTVHLIDGILDL